MKEIVKSLCLAAACGCGLIGGSATAQNVLYNPSFELKCSVAAGWSTFGNVQSINFYMTSGTHAVKMFGPFCCPLGYSGFYQDYPAQPGETWEASAFVTNPTWDALSWNNATPAGSRSFISVEFLDASGTHISAPQEFISTKLDHHTDAMPILQTVAPAVAPPGTAFVRFAGFFEQANWAGGAVWYDDATLNRVGGANVLFNSSFEDQGVNCFGSPAAGWVNFGNGQVNPGESPHTGDNAAKLFGGYYAATAVSGWYQDAGAQAGSQWQADAWAVTRANDLIQNGNDVFLTVEFFDADGHNISEYETPFSPYRSPGLATGAANDLQYHFLQTGVATAPENTAHVRCLIYQVQNNYAGGADWWDDVELIQTNAVTCFADYNVDGGVDGADIEAFFIDWAAGITAADVNFDGGVDGGDVEAFFVQWSAGGC